jgi:pimeloyl-ACP methyl ester carboxylesterase
MYVRATGGPVVVFYHGNAGSACDRAWLADVFTAAGYDYVLVEYAGYSNDPVPPSHERIAADVLNVIDYLATQQITSVALIGESIGAGVASYHARLAPPERLLLIAPFPDLQAVAATRFWFYPTWLLVDNVYQPATDLAAYRGPTTIIHGTDDRIIPFRLGEALYQSLPGAKTLVPVVGAGHNNLFRFETTHAALYTFLGTDPTNPQ